MDKLEVIDESGMRVSIKLVKKINEIVDWINNHKGHPPKVIG